MREGGVNERTEVGMLFAGLVIACATVFSLSPATVTAAPDRPPIAVHAQDAVAETLEIDILPNDFVPRSRSAGAIRIGVGFATSGSFSIVIKSSAGVVLDELRFNAAALTADDAFTFTWPVRPDRSYNFQTTASGDVTLYIDEIQGGKL